FNTQIGSVDKKYFVGLPSPAAAACVAGLVWCFHAFEPASWLTLLTMVVVGGTGVLMVSNILYRSFKDLDLRGRVPFAAILLVVLIFVVIALDPATVLFTAFLIYALSGPVRALFRNEGKRARQLVYSRSDALGREFLQECSVYVNNRELWSFLMFIKRRPSWAIPESEVTPESIYLNRRKFMSGVIASAATVAMPGLVQAKEGPKTQSLEYHQAEGYSTDEDVAPYEAITGYNNFYEFGTGKEDPARHAGQMSVDPWAIDVEGECGRPGRYALEDLLRPRNYEERICRLRCVEAWSMVIPWVGVPLGDVLKRLESSSKAKYVYFETLHRPEQMPGQRSLFSTIDWPYREGLRMDEAMNELSFLAVGLYGKTLPNQNGAPIR